MLTNLRVAFLREIGVLGANLRGRTGNELCSVILLHV